MSFRWLWWSILAACVTMAAVYLLVLAINRASPDRSYRKARLVWRAEVKPAGLSDRLNEN